MFSFFLANTDEAREQLSNTFDFWDSVPRYSVSRQQMDKLVKEKGHLPLFETTFQYHKTPVTVQIQPVQVKTEVINKQTGEKTETINHYYPSASEELVEDALRKIATEQSTAFVDEDNKSFGVNFTLNQLRKELKRRGHTRSYQQIMLSLEIMANSRIRIEGDISLELSGKKFIGFFNELTTVSRKQLEADPNTKCRVVFNPWINRAIRELHYRQFNYGLMMSHKAQLSRWLHKQLALKYTFASLVHPFKMHYSTIKRDSGLLAAYGRERKAIEAVDEAFQELQDTGVLQSFKKEVVSGARGRIEDVVYVLTATMAFTSAMKAANKRLSINTENAKTSKLPVKNR
ncbi:hypothetical protein A1332_13820 [Methylomonas methanica]|uniref:Replication protein n=1 Tax=Methylomonas methanica TaxID=421 RepID=A0A177MJ96_METMH|nr:hypothetical protein A1332_13820 [Methylomonas methanica]